MVFGWGWHLLFCARAKRDERKVVSDAVWHGAGIKDKKGPPPKDPKTKQKRGKKEKTKKRKEGGEKKKKRKTTAPRIPAWSPTVVLTGRHSG